MCCVGEELCGRDTDELFSYSTVGQVRIKDRRLGILRYAMVFVIILYVGVNNIFVEKGWAIKKVPTGTVRLEAQSPTLTEDTKRAGCGIGTKGCIDNFRPYEKVSYCKQSELLYIKQLRCQRLDSFSNTWASPNSLRVATRFERTTENSVCNESASTTCPHMWKQIWSSNKTYAMGIEDYTVLIEHAIGESGVRSRNIPGSLVSKSGSLCDRPYININHSALKVENPPQEKCRVVTNQTYTCTRGDQSDCGFDVFNLGVLLEAGDEDDGGVAPLDEPMSEGGNEPYRYGGLTVELNVRYTNIPDGHFFTSKAFYTYEYDIRLIKGAKTSWTETIEVFDGTTKTRNVLKYRGVNIVATVGGVWYDFDPTTLLIQLTTSLTLFAIASTVVEVAMIHFMPLRGVYRSMKIRETADFSILSQQLSSFSKKAKAELTYSAIKKMLKQVDSTEIPVHHDESEDEDVETGSAGSSRASFELESNGEKKLEAGRPRNSWSSKKKGVAVKNPVARQ